jgi:hypothetical protein
MRIAHARFIAPKFSTSRQGVAVTLGIVLEKFDKVLNKSGEGKRGYLSVRFRIGLGAFALPISSDVALTVERAREFIRASFFPLQRSSLFLCRTSFANRTAVPLMLLKRVPCGKSPLQLLILAAVIAVFYLNLRERWQPASPQTNHSKIKDYIAMMPLRLERFEPNWTTPLPQGRPIRLPRIQHQFSVETSIAKAERERRASAVRDSFLHAYGGYKNHSWAKDELAPVTGEFKTPFCGWSATLVDSLDTLYIMGLHEEFQEALKEVYNIDFTGTEGCMINLFEVTIRHLGGLLSAYDVSEAKHEILLIKAVELGEILYTAFDTPNRMPSPHYLWSA